MSCEYCEHKGYITDQTAVSNDFKASVRMCPKCNDIKAYSDYIKARYSIVKEIKDAEKEKEVEKGKVLDFKRKAKTD